MRTRPDDHEIDDRVDRLAERLPPFAGRLLTRLRKPSARWTRRAVALLLIAAGPFGFLPVLGYWMLALGILLLARDIPWLRRATIRTIIYAESWWRERGARRRR